MQTVNSKASKVFTATFEDAAEERCREALFAWRFPQGFECEKCGNEQLYRLSRGRILQCSHCSHQFSLTGKTLFEGTKLPLFKWFVASEIVLKSKGGLSATHLQNELDVSYNTASMMKRKIGHFIAEPGNEVKLGHLINLIARS